MSENLKLQLAVIAKNTITTIGFILLAMFFNKWWLSLLAILFLTFTVKDKESEDKK